MNSEPCLPHPAPKSYLPASVVVQGKHRMIGQRPFLITRKLHDAPGRARDKISLRHVQQMMAVVEWACQIDRRIGYNRGQTR